ncbi:MAG: glycosyltransferase [Flavobacteriales bacterium]
MFQGARILVAPLDWGLGHATRCIPVIEQLLALGARPVIGADRSPLALLREAFPELPHVRIPGVEVRYARGRSQALAMAAQFPALLRSVRTEQRLLADLRRTQHLDAVISDQRFGLHAPGLPSVLITHQVFPFTPLAQGLLRRYNLRAMERFHRCWIPDHAQAPGLAGALAHGAGLPRNARYIGPLSRLSAAQATPPDGPYRIVCVISGPEPQRGLLEEALLGQLQRIEGRHLLVRGVPAPAVDAMRGNVRCIGHLGAEALAGALLQAELIVSRTGYTTVMDLEHLGRRALLIPTPGQPEQEYLGGLHGATGRHRVQAQHRVDVAAALADPQLRMPVDPVRSADGLHDALVELAEMITT